MISFTDYRPIASFWCAGVLACSDGSDLGASTLRLDIRRRPGSTRSIVAIAPRLRRYIKTIDQTQNVGWDDVVSQSDGWV